MGISAEPRKGEWLEISILDRRSSNGKHGGCELGNHVFVATDHSALSDELKRAFERAWAVFMPAIEPALQRQFAEDGFPDTLCHYTDFWGLKGILEAGALWATYSQTLNDDSETEYGLDVMREYVTNLPNQHTAERLTKAIGRLDERTFACCFCERSDLLSMWIAYASRGGGYCIEFDGRALLGSSFPPFLKLPFKMSYRPASPVRGSG